MKLNNKIGRHIFQVNPQLSGVTLVYPMEGEAMRFLNRLGNVFFAKACSYVLGVRIGDSLCGTKLFAQRDYRRMTAWRKYFGDFDPFGDFELLFPAAILGLGIVDVPIAYKDRNGEILRYKEMWRPERRGNVSVKLKESPNLSNIRPYVKQIMEGILGGVGDVESVFSKFMSIADTDIFQKSYIYATLELLHLLTGCVPILYEKNRVYLQKIGFRALSTGCSIGQVSGIYLVSRQWFLRYNNEIEEALKSVETFGRDLILKAPGYLLNAIIVSNPGILKMSAANMWHLSIDNPFGSNKVSLDIDEIKRRFAKKDKD